MKAKIEAQTPSYSLFDRFEKSIIGEVLELFKNNFSIYQNITEELKRINNYIYSPQSENQSDPGFFEDISDTLKLGEKSEPLSRMHEFNKALLEQYYADLKLINQELYDLTIEYLSKPSKFDEYSGKLNRRDANGKSYKQILEDYPTVARIGKLFTQANISKLRQIIFSEENKSSYKAIGANLFFTPYNSKTELGLSAATMLMPLVLTLGALGPIILSAVHFGLGLTSKQQQAKEEHYKDAKAYLSSSLALPLIGLAIGLVATASTIMRLATTGYLAIKPYAQAVSKEIHNNLLNNNSVHTEPGL